MRSPPNTTVAASAAGLRSRRRGGGGTIWSASGPPSVGSPVRCSPPCRRDVTEKRRCDAEAVLDGFATVLLVPSHGGCSLSHHHRVARKRRRARFPTLS